MGGKITLNFQAKSIAACLLLILTFTLGNSYAQTAPNITYSTPQVYTSGTAITPLSPVNTGGTVYPANYGTPATFASPNTPYGLAVDASNNVYTTDQADGYVYKYNSSGTNTLLINTPYYSTSEVAVDGSGNIYVSAFSITWY